MLRRLPALYFAAVATVALLRSVAGVPSVGELGLTPDRLAAGKLWLLATSGVLVSGPAVPELAGLALALAVFDRALGPRLFVVLAPVCHVGSTLLAYATLAAFTGDADGSGNSGIDYGVSAVWLGVLGALLVAYMPAARAGARAARAIVAVCAAAAVIGVVFFSTLAAAEHGFGFVLGAVVALVDVSRRRRRAARQPARSAASRESARAASV